MNRSGPCISGAAQVGATVTRIRAPRRQHLISGANGSQHVVNVQLVSHQWLRHGQFIDPSESITVRADATAIRHRGGGLPLIANNAVLPGTYSAGQYEVYINTNSTTQIREIYVVQTWWAHLMSVDLPCRSPTSTLGQLSRATLPSLWLFIPVVGGRVTIKKSFVLSLRADEPGPPGPSLGLGESPI